MLPRDLKPEQFSSYPPEARKLVSDYLGTLRQLPLSFLPVLLREIIDYDFRFPAERKAREMELKNLDSLSADQRKDWLQEFAEIHLSPQLESLDWVGGPAQFMEQLSTHLWSTHQLDAFRQASTDYADRLRLTVPPEPLPLPRLGITVVGEGVASYNEPLFRKLRPQGVYFSGIKPENGSRLLLDAVAVRARAHPAPYAHWYIDGGETVACDSTLACISYSGLEPVRAALLRRIRTEVARPGMGPEALRTFMARIRLADLGLDRTEKDKPKDEVLDRFRLSLLTEGSGTQVFSTTFAEWAARESLRRAQPLTLLVRFAPRQRQKPMSELLSANTDRAEVDPVGSLLDADMGAYYNWLNQQRLPGAEQSSFLVWFEGHDQALAIGQGMPRGTTSNSPADVGQLLSWTV